MIIRRIKSLLLLSCFLAATVNAGDFDSAEVPLLTDLQTTRSEILAGCRPLLLEFASEYCEYCNLLEENILKPIRRNRDYDRRVVMRKVILGDSATISGFDGQPASADQLGDEYQIRVTPTLIFVDQQGKEIAERMVGVTTLDFYGGYLDQALDTARLRLQQQGKCQPLPWKNQLNLLRPQ